jgi:hypothetical protein
VQAVKVHIAILMAALAVAITVPLHSRAENRIRTLSLEEILTRVEAARLDSSQTGPFLLQRQYRLYRGDNSQPMSQVKAEINVVPPHDRDYRIVEAKGSNRGEKVVRKILEYESDAEKKSPHPTAVIRANYDFVFVGNETYQGSRCYVLQLKPKREAPGLIAGKAWVDAHSFLVRKVEGELAKSPSWWVRKVNVTVLFGDVGGIWMQTETRAVADVRLAGKYTVSGEATGVQGSSAEVAQRKARRNRASLAAEVAAGVLVRR